MLAVEDIVARETAARIKSNDVKRLKVDSVVALGLRDDVTLAVQANVAVIETLNAQIDKLEKCLQACVQPSPGWPTLRRCVAAGTEGFSSRKDNAIHGRFHQSLAAKWS